MPRAFTNPADVAIDTKAVDAPVRGSHLFEQIHDILWRKILGGEIEPSQRLKEVEWANKLGVSRTPVREAMRKMQQEGILLPTSQGGYQVRPVSVDDLMGLYRCRCALESQAVREAAENFDPAAEKRFERHIRMTDDAIKRGDLDQVFELNTQFHRGLIEQSRNTHLIRLCDTLRKLTLYYRTALLNRAKSDSSRKRDYVRHLKADQKAHRAIVAALAEANPEKAVGLMWSHLLETAQHMDIS